MIRLEYRDEKSSKFWEIEVEGASHTVRYGKIGTDGQTKTKAFDDAEAAQAAADKLVAAKTKKGYEPVEASDGGAATPADALRALLRGLCESDEDRQILENLCAAVVDASDEEFEFEDNGFEYEPAIDAPYRESVPESFTDISRYFSNLWWDGGGPMAGYGLSADGRPIADDEGFSFLEDEEDDNHARVADAGGAEPAFGWGQNWTFFDPTRKLSNGEPALAFISHESVEWVEVRSADPFNYKQIFLRMISDAMLETDYIEEVYC